MIDLRLVIFNGFQGEFVDQDKNKRDIKNIYLENLLIDIIWDIKLKMIVI